MLTANRDYEDSDLHLFQNVGHSNRCCWFHHIPSPGVLLLQIGIVLKSNCKARLLELPCHLAVRNMYIGQYPFALTDGNWELGVNLGSIH